MTLTFSRCESLKVAGLNKAPSLFSLTIGFFALLQKDSQVSTSTFGVASFLGIDVCTSRVIPGLAADVIDALMDPQGWSAVSFTKQLNGFAGWVEGIHRAPVRLHRSSALTQRCIDGPNQFLNLHVFIAVGVQAHVETTAASASWRRTPGSTGNDCSIALAS